MSKAFIYALLDPRTQQIKYIGKTNSLKTRFSHHCSLSCNKKNTYRCNWIKGLINKGLKPILEVIDVVSKDKVDFWEQHYISLYKSWGFKLTNLTSGGEGCFEHSIETKRLISEKTKGRYKGWKRSEETKRKLAEAQRNRTDQTRSKNAIQNISNANKARSKEVLQLDLKGNVLKVWKSREEAATTLNISYSGIANCSLGYSKSSNGYIWKLKNQYE